MKKRKIKLKNKTFDEMRETLKRMEENLNESTELSKQIGHHTKNAENIMRSWNIFTKINLLNKEYDTIDDMKRKFADLTGEYRDLELRYYMLLSNARKNDIKMLELYIEELRKYIFTLENK